jgi:hypothetical protein
VAIQNGDALVIITTGTSIDGFYKLDQCIELIVIHGMVGRGGRMILAGSNCDLIAIEHAQRKARELSGAFMECSAPTGVGVKAVFEEAVKALVEPRRIGPRSKCLLG